MSALVGIRRIVALLAGAVAERADTLPAEEQHARRAVGKDHSAQYKSAWAGAGSAAPIVSGSMAETDGPYDVRLMMDRQQLPFRTGPPSAACHSEGTRPR